MMLPDFNKIGGFFEEHVEKMVLAVVGALCAWLLITRVIFSPNVVPFDGKNTSPAAIDEQIYAKARPLQQKLNEPPEDLPPYDPKVDDYVAVLDSAIKGVDVGPVRLAPYPVVAGPGGPGGGVYGLPRVGEVTDVDVEHIRTVAYVPTVVITPETPYDKGNNEPNDLDFVTVEAKFDVAGMFQRFQEIFVEDPEEQYADPCLAKPVFAAVQLQRQELNDDGTWGPWQVVPRPRIDPYKRLFQVVERVQDLPPGGLRVQLLQFGDKQVQITLLQPEAYQIASADEEWFPPVLHREFLDIQRRISTEEKLAAREKEKQDQTRTTTPTDTRTNRRPTRTRGGAGGDAYGGAGDAYGGGDARTRGGRSRDRSGLQGQMPGDTGRLSDRRGSRGGRTATDGTELYDMGMDGLGLSAADQKAALRKTSVNQVYIKFDKLRLTWQTEFAKLREPLVFWAHDDSIEPVKTYRYRIRLGVFNPLAGTNQLSEKDKALKDQVILWSDFSAVTKPVEIMDRLYFFANSVREMDKAVTVQVSRLALGRWYSHDFVVRQGEQIGNVIEPEPEKPDRNALGATALGATLGGPMGGPMGSPMGGPMGDPMGRFPGLGVPQEKSNVPETVDCATGAVMVDAVVVNDWSGAPALRTRNYHDMLYSYDGVSIEHMPVGATYWEPQLQTVFSHIARKQREPHEPFKAFGTTGRQQRMGDEYMGEEMYMEDMGGMSGRPLY